MTAQTQPEALAQECADYATSLRSSANTIKLRGGEPPQSFLRAADLFERATAEVRRLESIRFTGMRQNDRMAERIAELEAKVVNIEDFRVAVTEAARTPLFRRIAELEADLAREAQRTAAEKLRADQMTEQHRMQSAMNAEARELLSHRGGRTKPDHPQTRMDAQPEAVAEMLPAGWVAVPVEPTEAMLNAVHESAYVTRALAWREAETARYAALLAAAPKLPQGDGWLPIESAPQYTTILLLGTHGMTAAYMESCGDWKADGVDTTYDMASVVLQIGTLTHWMPLPAPPKEQDDAKR